MDEMPLFKAAWKDFCEFYYRHGAFKYGIKNLWGPYFREEKDVVFHLARFCFKKFNQGYIHLDSPISHYYFSGCTKDEGTVFIDIDVTDPKLFVEKNAPHGIFAEVKWFCKDMGNLQRHFMTGRVKSIMTALEKLHKQVNRRRCKYGIMCIIDEEPEHTGISNERRRDWETKFSPVKVLLFQPTVACKLFKETSRRIRVLKGYPYVDLGIANVVEELDRCGFKTTASCSGLSKDHPEGIFPLKEEPNGCAYVRVEGKCLDLIEIGEETGWDWRLDGKAYANVRRRKPIDFADFFGKGGVVYKCEARVAKKPKRAFDGTKLLWENQRETPSSKEEALQNSHPIDATSLYFHSTKQKAIQERIKLLENVLKERPS